MFINSVLMPLHTYWARIFIIPKGVISKIIALCRNFLGDGKIVYNRSPPVAWSQVCKGKSEGGLGIHDSDKWNRATIGELLWDIAGKIDSLWVKWVNHTYLKGQSL